MWNPILASGRSFARGIWPKGRRPSRTNCATMPKTSSARRGGHAVGPDRRTAGQEVQRLASPVGREWRIQPGHRRPTAAARVASGFDLWAVVAEYRALRASEAICTDILHFPARVLVVQAARAADGTATLIPDTVLVHLLVRRAVRGSPGFSARRTGPWRPRGRNDGHAAASTDGHVAHDADRLASTRARRAAAARDVRSAGIASPVPKYISSGVCPRNAECGSTRLCSST